MTLARPRATWLCAVALEGPGGRWLLAPGGDWDLGRPSASPTSPSRPPRGAVRVQLGSGPRRGLTFPVLVRVGHRRCFVSVAARLEGWCVSLEGWCGV